MLRLLYLKYVNSNNNMIPNNINNIHNINIRTNTTVHMNPVVRIINKIINSYDGNMKVYKLGA